MTSQGDSRLIHEDKIRDYIERLCAKYQDISSVWLLGSRANGSATATSDWDLMAFGNATVLDHLRGDVEFHIDGVDLLVVDGATGAFEKPWGRAKEGSLKGWHWRQLSELEAEYLATKFTPVCVIDGSEMGPLDMSEKRALRVWPLEAHNKVGRADG